MDMRQMEVSRLSKPIKVMDFDLKLSDNDINWLMQDFDYCYDDYFDNKKRRNNEKMD